MNRLLTVATLVAGALANAIPNAPAPAIEIVGAPGTAEAAYWVVAEDAEGRWTCAVNPAVANNVPAGLSTENAVRITVAPVEGAVRYAVLKTLHLPAPEGGNVTVAKPGDQVYYYWIEYWNNWRRSAVAGPLEARCATPEGNVITWERSPLAMFYNVYRTETPEPPLGRGHYAVALQVAAHPRFTWLAHAGDTEVTDKGRVSQTIAGRGATPVTEPPRGSLLCLVDYTDGTKPVRDTGGELRRFDASNVNTTERDAVDGPAAHQADIIEWLGGQVVIQGNNQLEHLRCPSFGAGHAEQLVVFNRFDSGGHSEYHSPPTGVAGYKSWINTITARTESHTASQHGSLTTHLDVYGSGDAIPFGNTLNFFGTNNDGGDEGAYSARNSVHRYLNAWNGTLGEDAPTGSMKLTVAGGMKWNGAGAERLLVNLTQAHSEGRIQRVDNVTVRGKGTNWTQDMVHRYISFDVDNVREYRMWYWVTEVKSPTELTILAKTGWSAACNLGYSRFIWDPEERDGPQPSMPNSAALRKLPEDRLDAAREGAYILAPGVRLGDPWKHPQGLNTEPLTEDWHAGDNVRIVAGPQGYIAFARYMMYGDMLPQDQVGGINVVNRTNRITNFAGITVGGVGQKGFRSGIEIGLASEGDGDGLVISAAREYDSRGFPTGNSGVYRGCIVVPNEIPAMVGHHNWRYPGIRWHLSEDGHDDALEIAHMNTGPVAARFDRNGRTTLKRAVVTDAFATEGPATLAEVRVGDRLVGNGKTRGVAVLSGNGQTRRFEVAFESRVHATPVVTFSTNQFAAARLVNVDHDKFVVEFKEAPEAGEKNIRIWWLAME